MEIPVDTDIFNEKTEQALQPTDQPSWFGLFRAKFQRVRQLDLGRLKRGKSCRFYCRPAIENRDAGVGSSLKDPEPRVRIMINHCLRCLRTKGHMDKVMKRRLSEKEMMATPIILTSPSSPQRNQVKVVKKPYHNIFGGWISISKDPDTLEDEQSGKMKGFRRLLSDVQSNRKNVVTKRAIIIGDRLDEAYVNNYEDFPDDSNGIDFGKLEEKIRDWAPTILVGAFIFFGVLFLLLFPLINFINMCVDDFRTNCRLFGNILCCLDPKYTLVKRECKRRGISIPKRREYKKLMKQYKKLQEEHEGPDEIRVET